MSLTEIIIMWIWLSLTVLRRVVDSLSQQLMVKFCEHDEATAKLSDFEDFVDSRSDGESVTDEDITRESLESSQDREESEAYSTTDLIPGLPNDLVSVQIWPRIASSFGKMRTVNKEWRMFVRTTPEWVAMEVVSLTFFMKRPGLKGIGISYGVAIRVKVYFRGFFWL
ncbi:hypothetical protein R1sor_006345 [Riccia sorocarpa]|uniref:Uncharacterized protein n=1 Tax=Riccia sorocarpa TaxID=122646 RepID=A0ABD3HQF2_9MARC